MTQTASPVQEVSSGQDLGEDTPSPRAGPRCSLRWPPPCSSSLSPRLCASTAAHSCSHAWVWGGGAGMCLQAARGVPIFHCSAVLPDSLIPFRLLLDCFKNNGVACPQRGLSPSLSWIPPAGTRSERAQLLGAGPGCHGRRIASPAGWAEPAPSLSGLCLPLSVSSDRLKWC